MEMMVRWDHRDQLDQEVPLARLERLAILVLGDLKEDLVLMVLLVNRDNRDSKVY